MYRRIIIVWLCSLLFQAAFAQGGDDEFRAGLGVGINYGGIGVQAGYSPVKTFGTFVGVGYNLEGVGYNVGMTWDFLPDEIVSPTINFMYGYNAVILIENADQFNKTYHGPSGGVGVRVRLGKNYVDLNLILPMRSNDYEDDYDALKRNPSIDLPKGASPVLAGLGYHFVF